jgi:hypothetical protein
VSAHLAADGRELLDEDDLSGYELLGKRLSDELAKLGLELLRAFASRSRYDVCPDELAAPLQVAEPDDGARDDRVVVAQHVLDFVWAEGTAAARDHVFGASHEPEEALLVGCRDIAGQIPVAAERALRLVRRLPVAAEQCGRAPAHGDVSLDAHRQLVSLAVDDRDMVTGQRAPE